jgi:putative mRNA 3-end processing factor
MDATRRLVDMGFLPIRKKTSNGSYKPHFSLSFMSGGKRMTFGVDTARNGRIKDEGQYFLITHAHSDHYGSSAMLSERALASKMTARALELRHDKYFKGITFEVGETIDVEGVKVRTYDTHHSIGSTAFYWENDLGVRILVTGDVKNIKGLPKCDILVTEATYGHPEDPGCIFQDDLEAFERALDHKSVGFGAYSFGKAQRAVSLIRSMGLDCPIEMDKSSLWLTKHLLGEDAGEIGDLGKFDSRICITSPWSLNRLPYNMKKFVLTGQKYYEHQTICISDHLDFNGLRDMVYELDPGFTLVYHPEEGNSTSFSQFLNKNGKESCTLSGIKSSVNESILNY